MDNITNERTAVEAFMQENEAMVKVIAAVAIEQAAPAVITAYEKRKAAIKKEEKRKLIFNTKMLLRNYRELKLYAEDLDDEITSSIETDLSEDENERLIQMLEFSEDIVGTIKESTQKTIVMLQHVEIGMKTLGVIYRQEKNKRPYEIIRDYRLYGMRKIDVAKKYGINPRTVEKTEDRVAERLSVLLFGIFGLKFDN